jgi:hypothetical protein
MSYPELPQERSLLSVSRARTLDQSNSNYMVSFSVPFTNSYLCIFKFMYFIYINLYIRTVCKQVHFPLSIGLNLLICSIIFRDLFRPTADSSHGCINSFIAGCASSVCCAASSVAGCACGCTTDAADRCSSGAGSYGGQAPSGQGRERSCHQEVEKRSVVHVS